MSANDNPPRQGSSFPEMPTCRRLSSTATGRRIPRPKPGAVSLRRCFPAARPWPVPPNCKDPDRDQRREDRQVQAVDKKDGQPDEDEIAEALEQVLAELHRNRKTQP